MGHGLIDMKTFGVMVPRWPGSSELRLKYVEAESCDDADRIGTLLYGKVVMIMSMSKREVYSDE